MNLQTVKPRARWQPNLSLWLVTHPLSERGMITILPRDGGAALLREHVLPRQVQLMGVSSCPA